MDAKSQIDLHYIIWRDETVAIAHHVVEEPNQIFRGQLELIHIHPRLERYWDWFHRQFYGDKGNDDGSIPMPGFIFDKWSVEFPDGRVQRSEIPIPDRDYKAVTWKLRT
jgi:hypothetical protein